MIIVILSNFSFFLLYLRGKFSFFFFFFFLVEGRLRKCYREEDKPIIEIFSDDIIGGKFNTHGVAIEEDKDPCPVVSDGIP